MACGRRVQPTLGALSRAHPANHSTRHPHTTTELGLRQAMSVGSVLVFFAALKACQPDDLCDPPRLSNAASTHP